MQFSAQITERLFINKNRISDMYRVFKKEQKEKEKYVFASEFIYDSMHNVYNGTEK